MFRYRFRIAPHWIGLKRSNKKYPPEEARRIIKKLEIHYTLKHGSWLDIAEIELNDMTRQCLSRRIENIDLLKTELSAREKEWKFSFLDIERHFLR